MSPIPWDQPATLIDLDGKAPLIATVRDCATHFAMFKPFAKEQARVLLTQPVHREGRKTRTWLLEPAEIEQLAQRLKDEG
ncbi:hypothetical protein WG907_12080 [Sphingobium sp. AN558]|uniref:hypothetical protein n=1 Tax=Sphingobium sp. AN558 TaxID=3133442 RepID=UPI0030C1D4DE